MPSSGGGKNRAVALVLILALFLAACAAPYTYKAIPFKDPAAYPNARTFMGAEIGAEAFYDAGRLKEVFGFNLKAAGVTPVQVGIDNPGAEPLTVAYGAMVLDERGNWWELLPAQVVYDRVNAHTSGGLAGNRIFKQTFLFGLAGAVAGAAVGVVTGTNVGEAMGKGAAVGGALGASTEILTSGYDPGDPASIASDFSGRDLGGRVVAPNTTEHGFLYFPAEMARPVALRLYLADGPADSRASSAARPRQIELPL